MKKNILDSRFGSGQELVYLRHGIGNGRLERRRLVMYLESTTGSEGNYMRVYTRSFRMRLPIGVLAGRYNMVADVLSNGTVYSGSLPFSNEFWGTPYIAVL